MSPRVPSGLDAGGGFNVCFRPIADIRKTTDAHRMRWLKAARRSLLASILLYALGLALGRVIDWEVGFAIALFAMLMMAASAIACVTIQLGLSVRRRNR